MSLKPHRRLVGRPRSSEGGLTRQFVVTEALTLLHRRGMQSLTMRRLANHLGVTPMALYNHFVDKRDLLLGVAAALFDSADFTSDHPDWRERIRTCFREMRRVCLAHPEALSLIEAIDSGAVSVFVPMEMTLSALSSLALRDEEALSAYFLLVNFTLGQVTYEVRGPFKGLDLRESPRFNDAFAALPHVAKVSLKDDWDFDAAFEFGLSTIIAGLEGRAIVDRNGPG